MARRNSSSGSGAGNIRHENGNGVNEAIKTTLNTFEIERPIVYRLQQIWLDLGADGVGKAILFIKEATCSKINCEYREFIASISQQRLSLECAFLDDGDEIIFNAQRVIDYLREFEVVYDPSITADGDNTEDVEQNPNFGAFRATAGERIVFDVDDSDDEVCVQQKKDQKEKTAQRILALQSNFDRSTALIQKKFEEDKAERQVVLRQIAETRTQLLELALKNDIQVAAQKQTNERQAVHNGKTDAQLQQQAEAIAALTKSIGDRAAAADADSAKKILEAAVLAAKTLKAEAKIRYDAETQRENEKVEADRQRARDIIAATERDRLTAIATGVTLHAVKLAADEVGKLTLQANVTAALAAYYNSNPLTGRKQRSIDRTNKVFQQVIQALTARGHTVCIPKKTGKCPDNCRAVVTVKMHIDTFFGMLSAGQPTQYDGDRMTCTFCKEYSDSVFAKAKAAKAEADAKVEADAKAAQAAQAAQAAVDVRVAPDE